MSIQPGYNIVTETVAETDTELIVLEFFRKLAIDAEIQTPVTVTHLETLLLDTVEDDRSEVLTRLRDILRESTSLDSMDAVQFLIDGRIFMEDRFRIRVEQRNEAIYIDVGDMFVEKPQQFTTTHAVARK